MNDHHKDRILARRVARELTDNELDQVAGSGGTGPYETAGPGSGGTVTDTDTHQN